MKNKRKRRTKKERTINFNSWMPCSFVTISNNIVDDSLSNSILIIVSSKKIKSGKISFRFFFFLFLVSFFFSNLFFVFFPSFSFLFSVFFVSLKTKKLRSQVKQANYFFKKKWNVFYSFNFFLLVHPYRSIKSDSWGIFLLFCLYFFWFYCFVKKKQTLFELKQKLISKKKFVF